MTIEFRLPELGENITEAEVAEILVKVGDTIEAEQPVLELETEKAVVELPSPRAGVVTKVHVAEGATIKIGTIILTIDDAVGTTQAEAAATTESENDANSDVVAVPPESPAEPLAPAAKPQASTQPAKAPTPTPTPAAVARPAQPETKHDDRPPPPAGPATRHMARRLGVDLYEVTGTAVGGRITPEDIEAYVSNRLKSTPSVGAATAATPLPDFTKFGPVERRKLSKLNRTASDQLSRSWNLIPHVTQHELADVTDLDSVRRKYMQSVGKTGPKITVTAVVLKACVQLLTELPEFNSSLDTETGELVLKQYFNIGVAVDTEHGLVVPVIRDADEKSILEIATELNELAEKARNRKLELADMQGATFTITNLGGIGGTAFTPIVNHPEVAILGLSRSRTQPAYVEGVLQERLMLPLSLSYDHRVVNGADAARFVVRLSALLAQPFGLLANV